MSRLDNMMLAKHAEAAGQVMGGNLCQPTLRERLLSQKADLTQRLANVTAAIEHLDKNPNFEEGLNIIGKVNW